MVFMLLVLTAE
jgi:hypothetical protein